MAHDIAGRASRDRVLAASALLLVAAAALALWWPWTVQAASAEGRLALADVRGRALVVLDLSGREAPRRIELPAAPHELVRLPDGRVLASLERLGMLALVELESGAVELVELGGTPHGLALADGTLYVTDRSRDVVRRVRIEDWSELPAIPAGRDPHAVALTKGGRLAIANAGEGTLQIGARSIKVSELPEAVAAARGEVAVAGALGGAVEVFAASGEALRRSEVGGRPVRLVYGPAGETLAAALSAAGAVALLDRDGELTRVEVGGVPDGLAFSADGRWLFVGDLLTGAVATVDVARARVVARWDVAVSVGAVLLLTE